MAVKNRRKNPYRRSGAQQGVSAAGRALSGSRNPGYGRSSGKVRDFYAYQAAYYGGVGTLPQQSGYGRSGWSGGSSGTGQGGTGRSHRGQGSRGQTRYPAARKTYSPAAANSRTRSGAKAARREMPQDYSLIFIVIFFLVFGLVMLYSTSSYEAGIEFGDSAHYLKRQLEATLMGAALMWGVSRIPLSAWRKASGTLYVFSALLLLLVIPFGRTVNGAKRWIYIGPVSVQPAEISKLAVIIMTGALLSRVPRSFLQSWRKSFLVLLPAVIQAGMIYGITKNMSSAIIIAAIALCMMFVATEDYKRYGLLALAVAALGAAWIYLAMQDGSGGTFRSSRIRYWLDPQAYAESGAMQTLQGLYGIGSGGIFGKGLGQSMQKLGYIPEAQNDMIFSVICEELGLFGAVSIIAMFIILCWRMMVVAMRAKDLFSSLVVVGVMSQIAVQVVLNIAVVTNTIPNTGVTLPFFSYGGSAIVIQLLEIGLVLNVARNSKG